MAYDKNLDYSLAIQKAVQEGRMNDAAVLEQQRNEKIDDMGLNYEKTYTWQAPVTSPSKTTTTPTSTTSSAPVGFAGSATSVGVNTTQQQAWKDEQNANSKLWWETTDQAERDRLHARNQELAALLGGTVSFDEKTGTWSGDAAQQPILQPSFNFNYSSDARPTFESDYGARIDEMLNQILNRDDFSYDVNADPLYQQYANMYNREGNRAMNDTLASAAAGAGGMNSYAITAAQQANDYYSAQLGDKIPELYQMAYDMYLKDLDLQVRDLGLLEDMDNTQYNRYRDTMSDWVNDRDFAYNKYRDDMGDYKWQTEFDYGVSRDEVADNRYNNEWEYGVSRDEVSDNRYASETAYNKAMTLLGAGTMPDASTLEAAGISTAEATAYLAAVKAQNAPRATSGGGGGGDTPRAKDDEPDDGYQEKDDKDDSGYKGKPSNGSNPDAGYLGDGTGGAYDNNGTNDTPELNWNSVTDLAGGPTDAITLEQLLTVGGVREDDKGNVYWNEGWNGQNWREKLNEYKANPLWATYLY